MTSRWNPCVRSGIGNIKQLFLKKKYIFLSKHSTGKICLCSTRSNILSSFLLYLRYLPAIRHTYVSNLLSLRRACHVAQMQPVILVLCWLPAEVACVPVSLLAIFQSTWRLLRNYFVVVVLCSCVFWDIFLLLTQIYDCKYTPPPSEICTKTLTFLLLLV